MTDKTVIILCGGKGLRLRPLTVDMPKPLVKILDKPILEYIINHFIKYKYKRFVIATGYKSEKIEQFMSSNFKNLDYTIINSGDVGIIDRIKDCKEYIKDDCILCYGDTLANINIDQLIEFHKNSPDYLTITGYPIKIPFGVMNLGTNMNVLNFMEKPILNEVMNIGFFYISKKIFPQLLHFESFEEMLNSLSQNNKLRCYLHDGIHITVNTIAELQSANENIKKLYI